MPPHTSTHSPRRPIPTTHHRLLIIIPPPNTTTSTLLPIPVTSQSTQRSLCAVATAGDFPHAIYFPRKRPQLPVVAACGCNCCHHNAARHGAPALAPIAFDTVMEPERLLWSGLSCESEGCEERSLWSPSEGGGGIFPENRHPAVQEAG
jgi:hypothetical protein